MDTDQQAEPDSRETGDRARATTLFPIGTQAALAGILALAFVLRATMAVRTSVIFEDGPHFLSVAKLFSNGDWAGALSHPYHPLYSGLIAVFEPLLGDWEVAALSVSVTFGTAAVFALFIFLRDAFDPRSALFGAFLLAISPYAVRFTSDVESEGVYLAFYLAAFALLFRGLARGSSSVLAVAGVSAGFAYLARPEGAGLVVIGVGLLVAKGVGSDWRIRRVASACAALVGGAAIIAAPYLWVLMQHQGGLVLSGKKSVFRTLGLTGEHFSLQATDFPNLPLSILAVTALIAVLVFAALRTRKPDRTRSQVRIRIRMSVAVATSLLLAGLLLSPEDLKEFASVVISTLRPEVAVLVILGFLSIRGRGSRSRDVFIATTLAFYCVVLMGLLANYGYLSRRHVLPLVPLLLGYAGLGAGWLADRFGTGGEQREHLRSWLAARFSPAGILVGLALVIFAITAPKALHNHREEALAQRLAAEWLRDQGHEPGPVASNKRRTGYYAERNWVPLTEGSQLRSFESLVRQRVRYIVIDDRVLGDRDNLLPSPGFELREIYRAMVRGRSGMVYELIPSTPVGSQRPGAAIGAGPPEHENR